MIFTLIFIVRAAKGFTSLRLMLPQPMRCNQNEELKSGSQPIYCQESWGDSPPRRCPVKESANCVCVSGLYPSGLEVKRLIISSDWAPCVTKLVWQYNCQGGFTGTEELRSNTTSVECQKWCDGYGKSESECKHSFGPHCECVNGLVRGPPNGECMSPIQCPDPCPKENEVLRLKGDIKCDKFCAYGSIRQTQFCHPSLLSRCVCKAGYIRLEPGGLCINEDNCVPLQNLSTCVNRCGKSLSFNEPMHNNNVVNYGNFLRTFMPLPLNFLPPQMTAIPPLFPPNYGPRQMLNFNPNTYFQPCSCDLKCTMMNNACCKDFIEECDDICPCNSLPKCHCYYQATEGGHNDTSAREECECQDDLEP